MGTSETTKQLLKNYYEGFAKKTGWDSILSEDFKFIGGDMTKTAPVVGRLAYMEVIKRFSRLFTTMKIKQMIIQEDRACVIGTYDFAFPNGESITGDVAEIWEVKNEKLSALTIFFDTLTFNTNSK